MAFYQDKDTWKTFALPHPMRNDKYWKYNPAAYRVRLVLVRKERRQRVDGVTGNGKPTIPRFLRFQPQSATVQPKINEDISSTLLRKI
ncbi:hypothetical protein C1H46_009615 [Malus baccata]|uniref:Uncharacterized protein n=1 Tax=Malus baccata TaxID=106549 RepID=A0A540N133_MALBA|nr:hypothetical protein C1H46_009615 [Malus baccata]